MTIFVEKYAPVQTVGDLFAERQSDVVQTVIDRLRLASRERLAALLTTGHEKRQRVTCWLVNCEYTRRRVPPAFRPSLINYDDAELLLDALSTDLEWVAMPFVSM